MIYVNLKGDRGYVDLTFETYQSYKFVPLVSKLLEPGMTTHQTGKSSAIRLEMDGFNVPEGWVGAEPRVRAAFEAASRLISFFRQHRQALISASANSVPDPIR